MIYVMFNSWEIIMMWILCSGWEIIMMWIMCSGWEIIMMWILCSGWEIIMMWISREAVLLSGLIFRHCLHFSTHGIQYLFMFLIVFSQFTYINCYGFL